MTADAGRGCRESARWRLAVLVRERVRWRRDVARREARSSALGASPKMKNFMKKTDESLTMTMFL